ncbi:MAG: proline--tRNA ligase [Candidatus Eisenbacteria bacterium]|nr:proline--tRNA ligase [Candidatus Latescibacterota bacterium]MBD3302959.1 proline--tRNA ligase [Candidatus Eisenbacteria bacterium]
MGADGITPRGEDFSRWYQDIVQKAELADHSPVRGCMVIRPNGYAIWEKIQQGLDRLIKQTGHQNAYFPLFIPESFIHREAEHIEGFAPELAVVTHAGGEKLEEPLVVRPTSETIIYSMFAKWVQSYRDLPLLINQWANVVRWEMRTRLFLRTTEFLWQEGHTAHATDEEAETETLQMLEVYRRFAEEWMALPVYAGLKSDSEKFAGAVRTYSIEAMMQDGKALQAGTSHNLGQNFAKTFELQYQTADNRMDYCWNTSWGVSTRLVGALIMGHSDDKGLVIPPRLAPLDAVLVPIYKSDEQRTAVLEYAAGIEEELIRADFMIRTDAREQFTPGWKYAEWEMKGVPVRIEAGPKDLEKGHVVLVRRDDRSKRFVPRDGVADALRETLETMQRDLFEKARAFRDERTIPVDSYGDFRDYMAADRGFARAHWCGGAGCEEKVKEETKATIRTVPVEEEAREDGTCVVCGAASPRRVIWGKAY